MGAEKMGSSSHTQMERACRAEGKFNCSRVPWLRPALQLVLLCCMMQAAVGVVVFDLDACSEEVP